VEVTADTGKSSEKHADFFKEFDVVIATACSKVSFCQPYQSMYR
jgi:hypothetical protein